MNTVRLKTGTVGLAVLLGLGMTAYVGYHLVNRGAFEHRVTRDQMQSLLDAVPEVQTQVDGLLDRQRFEAALQQYDWTGKPPPEKPVEVAPAPVVEAKKPIERLVKLRMYKADAGTPEFGECILKYLADARVTVRNPEGVVRKVVGDRLDSPLEYIRVASISEAGVEFAYDDGRPSEFLESNEYPLTGYVYVDGDTIEIRPERPTIPLANQRYVAGPTTREISPTKFRLGTEDVQLFNDDYPRILTEDVVVARHRNPQTGKFDGVEVRHVEPNSIVARHGVQSGDVIKSINGEPVSSKEEAINYVKAHKDEFDHWEVEIENRGQTRIVTYYPPNK